MQHDAVRVEETAAWIKKSRKDLWRAGIALTLEPPDTEDCLFHSQQAVEKSLKALLVWHDQPFRKTHDLVELMRQCEGLEPTLAGAIRGLGALTRYAWEFRYPGETELPSVEAARAWVARVRDALDGVARLLPPEVIQ